VKGEASQFDDRWWHASLAMQPVTKPRLVTCMNTTTKT